MYTAYVHPRGTNRAHIYTRSRYDLAINAVRTSTVPSSSLSLPRDQERRQEDGATAPGACPATPGSDACQPDQPANIFQTKQDLSKEGIEDSEPGGHRVSLDTSTAAIAVESATSLEECQNLPGSKVVIKDSGAKTEEEAGAVARDNENNAAHSSESAIATESSAPSIDSLVRFSRFLSLLVASTQEEQTPSTTERERAALAELLQAR